jgi:predicted SnoaL-like aldol condensation-catalyzing enzyme
LQKDIDYKGIVSKYLKLVAQGKFEEGLRFFAVDCKTHNPFIKGNMKTISDAQITASKSMPTQNIEFSVKSILNGGDIVAAHTEMLFNKSNPNEGGLRQVHLFRFKGDKVVEYWDITQMITKDMPNAAGAFTAKV